MNVSVPVPTLKLSVAVWFGGAVAVVGCRSPVPSAVQHAVAGLEWREVGQVVDVGAALALTRLDTEDRLAAFAWTVIAIRSPSLRPGIVVMGAGE